MNYSLFWFIIGAVSTSTILVLILAAMRSRALRTMEFVAEDNAARSGPFSPLVKKHIKELKDLEEALSAAESEAKRLNEQHRLLTDNLAAAIVSRNAEGAITYCSPFTEVLTGYPLSEIFNSKTDFFLTIVHEEDRETYSRALRVSAAGEPFQFRYRFYHRSGILMWAETRTVPILNHEGNLISSLSITFDVTGTQLYQKQVEERNRDLQDFTYMVSHDLKAPIATIKGMLGVIEDSKEALSQDTDEALIHIERATRKLEELVSSVLEYGRLTNQDLSNEPVSVETVVREVAEDFASELTSCGATIDVSPTLPIVMGDRLRLYQVFSNLIGNAVKYRSPERPLKVSIEEKTSANPRFTSIVISDNGLGIAPDKLPSIFRPFFRAAEPNVSGTGIGLACVKKVVEKCGGDVSATSTPEEGSSFKITLKRVG